MTTKEFLARSPANVVGKRIHRKIINQYDYTGIVKCHHGDRLCVKRDDGKTSISGCSDAWVTQGPEGTIDILEDRGMIKDLLAPDMDYENLVGKKIRSNGSSGETPNPADYTGIVVCVHSDHLCVRRDDGYSGSGCYSAWRVGNTSTGYITVLEENKTPKQPKDTRIPDTATTILKLTPNPTTMGSYAPKLSHILKSAFSKEHKTLIKAGYLGACGELTETGKDALFAILLEANKDALVKLAEEDIKEAKEAKA